MADYVLDNAGSKTEQRFASLESCWDPVTIAHFDAIGVAEGWSCLEIGGGGGSPAAVLLHLPERRRALEKMVASSRTRSSRSNRTCSSPAPGSEPPSTVAGRLAGTRPRRPGPDR